MFKAANGFTKEQMKAVIKARNSGQVCADEMDDIGYKVGRNHCVIGCFIPDSLYNKDRMEGKGVMGLIRMIPELESFMPIEENGLLQFQLAHDCFDPRVAMGQVDHDFPQGKFKDFHEFIFAWIDQNVEDAVPIEVPVHEEVTV